MKNIILNLGQILVDVNIWHSRLAFLKLLNCNCCGLWSKSAAIQSTIDDYKLGRIDTEKFLNRLAEVSDVDVDGLKTLIKDAWNAMLKVDKQKFDDLLTVLSKRYDLQVYLINNTNPLHFDFIISELHRHYGAKFSVREQDNIYYLNFNIGREIIIPVYLSYKLKHYKGDGLVRELLHHYQLTPANTLLISPYQPEISSANDLGIKSYRWQLGWTQWSGDSLLQLPQIIDNNMKANSMAAIRSYA